MAILPIDSGRYGTREMIDIFEEQKKIDYQIEIEGVAAVSQSKLGLIPEQAGKKIFKAATSKKITATRVKELEAKSDHDTAALVEALSEICDESARPWIHYGLTSNDLVDTSNSMQIKDALNIIEQRVGQLATALQDKANTYAEIPAVGRTHGQHASIISFGLKFANWAAEMAKHIERIKEVKKRVLICKTLGVVGTGSLMGADAVDVQKMVAQQLGLYPADVTTQIVPRERYAEFVFTLALITSTLDKIAVEVRNLQRTEIGEVAEQFRKGQMGSSAVPVKRNPIKSERVSSLAKLVRSNISVAFENIPLWHERDLTNSANERFVIPTVSILTDEMLVTTTKIITNLSVNIDRITDNLKITKGQIYAEFVLEALIKKGVPRFEAYRDVQRVAFEANDAGIEYAQAIKDDDAFSSKLSQKEINEIFEPSRHLGASIKIINNVHKLVNDAVKSVA